MTNTIEDFDRSAKTWDSDPVKVARARAVADAICQAVPVTPAMRALEYGCGTGLLSFALYPRIGHVILADSSTGMLAVLADKLAERQVTGMQPLKLDLVTDPLPSDRFDLIYTLMTFHHIADTDKILRDLFLLLRSPGYLCVADLDAEDGTFHGRGFLGHKGFDREDIGKKARRAGFGSVDFRTVFQMTKSGSPGQKEFPVFLMVARK
ncbi:MAG: class I SAM-dependent methyltransferase [Chromatiaceae bacterium]|nr:class I SAM-dependent methyltransferase [Chromatiaceae bacterium]